MAQAVKCGLCNLTVHIFCALGTACLRCSPAPKPSVEVVNAATYQTRSSCKVTSPTAIYIHSYIIYIHLSRCRSSSSSHSNTQLPVPEKCP
eukprot:TRINITY_DN71996_c0_g1_i1.p1 TRINITY_DN71996_c0_g1~~TRINITY_DN71996_c0_g1_i1.p1  ORF type:complete len:103 (-),score=0.21 TRINITY_DN71996_c0_g1_i1:148-420(-)